MLGKNRTTIELRAGVEFEFTLSYRFRRFFRINMVYTIAVNEDHERSTFHVCRISIFPS